MKPIKSTTLAASAASLAASASSLHGVILLTEANFTATIGGSPSVVFFDLTQSGEGPFFSGNFYGVQSPNFLLEFYDNSYLGEPMIYPTGARLGQGVAEFDYYASRLIEGAVIDNNLSFGGNNFLASYGKGPWGIPAGETISGYLGLRIQTGDDWNFGWAEVEWYRGSNFDDDPSTITLKRFAYQTLADTPIAAGAIPEPATAGLFAALAAGAGALALRRRRAA
jgi:hypothetical protein